MNMIPLCELKGPADCFNRIDGKLSHLMLCGGNQLDELVKKCPYRKLYGYEAVPKVEDER